MCPEIQCTAWGGKVGYDYWSVLPLHCLLGCAEGIRGDNDQAFGGGGVQSFQLKIWFLIKS